MHPDAIIAGLRRELDRLNPDADDYKDRKAAIEQDIQAQDKLERPVATAEEPDTIADPNVAYLGGLRRELLRAAETRGDEIRAEIKRVEALIRKTEEDEMSDEPSAEEIAQRKQARAGRKVERAVNEPGGRPAPATASEDAKEKKE